MTTPVLELLNGYRPHGVLEARDHQRMLALVRSEPAPWQRSSPLHLTASALIVAPASCLVLLRWHQRLQGWFQVGGHADAGEDDPRGVALREAAEETGLTDLSLWPDESLLHLAVVPVPAGRGEPAHEHADLRFVLSTGTPDAARAESADAPLRWLTVDDATRATPQPNLRESLARLKRLLR